MAPAHRIFVFLAILLASLDSWKDLLFTTRKNMPTKHQPSFAQLAATTHSTLVTRFGT